MKPLPPIDISKLREIAYARWDAVSRPSASHNSESPDRYVATAAVRLWNGDSEEAVADYLVSVETEELGTDTGSGMRERALDFTGAIRAYLDELRPGRAGIGHSAH